LTRFAAKFVLLLCLAFAGVWPGSSPAFADECSGMAQPNLPITTPPANVGLASNFAGDWSGIWTIPALIRNTRKVTYCAQLRVAVRDSNSASVAYCTSPQPEADIKGGCGVYTATISGNRLTVTTRGNYVHLFTLGSGGTLIAQFEGRWRTHINRTFMTVFHKIQ
jgi:hypothetical protein